MADPRKSTLEIDRVRKEVEIERDRVKRSEDRTDYLENKRSRLEKENRRLREQRNTVHGFRVLVEYHPEYQDIFDEPSRLPEDGSASSLASYAEFIPSTGVEPTIEHEHVWQLRRILSEEDSASSVKEGDAELDVDAAHKVKARVVKEEGLHARIKQRVQQATEGDEARSKFDVRMRRGDMRVPSDAHQPGVPTRSHQHEPSEARQGGSKGYVFGNGSGRKRSRPATDPSHRRKSVCVRCWENSLLCDFNAQCSNCRNAPAKCIRKLCDYGDDCGNVRCPCLHSGQWDPNNPLWFVEEGPLPKRRKSEMPPQRREGDYWRPGREDDDR